MNKSIVDVKQKSISPQGVNFDLNYVKKYMFIKIYDVSMLMHIM
jgi:hypothetical protein